MFIVGGIAIFVMWLLVWPYLRDYLESRLIPLVKKRYGQHFANTIADLVVWLDNKICPIRNKINQAWTFLKTRIIRIKSTYTKESPTRAKFRDEVINKDGDKYFRVVEEGEIDYDMLPPEVRREMIRQNVKEGSFDRLEAIQSRMEEKAREEGFELELVQC